MSKQNKCGEGSPPAAEVDELGEMLFRLIGEATREVEAYRVTISLTNVLSHLAKLTALPGCEAAVVLGVGQCFVNEAHRMILVASGYGAPRSPAELQTLN